VPQHVRKLLSLPNLDEGIDFIAQTRQGKYWAIQSKFRSQHDKPLTRRELGTFSSLAFNTCRNIELAVVAHTASKPVSKRHLMRNTTEIGLDRWQSLEQKAWTLIVKKLKGRSAAPKPRTPRPHQSAAVVAAKDHFVRDGATRGRLIMPCGTGKSLTAYWISAALKAKTILVAVPSLALVRQSLADWTREYLAHGIKPDWICVCSDETVGKLDRDEFVGEVYDLGFPHLPAAIARLFFRVAMSVVPPQSFKFSMSIVDPDGNKIGEHERQAEALDQDTPVLIGLVLVGLRFEKEGIYKIMLGIDGSKLEEIGSFAVRNPKSDQEKQLLDGLAMK
jgi:hypothetical protein